MNLLNPIEHYILLADDSRTGFERRRWTREGVWETHCAKMERAITPDEAAQLNTMALAEFRIDFASYIERQFARGRGVALQEELFAVLKAAKKFHTTKADLPPKGSTDTTKMWRAWVERAVATCCITFLSDRVVIDRVIAEKGQVARVSIMQTARALSEVPFSALVDFSALHDSVKLASPERIEFTMREDGSYVTMQVGMCCTRLKIQKGVWDI